MRLAGWTAVAILAAACSGGDGTDDGDTPTGDSASEETADSAGDSGVAAPVDVDRDGYTSDVDCDDDDPKVHPGAAEVPYDGVDNDCSAATPDDDLDGDGYGIAGDCMDDDPAVNPGATEWAGNGVDDDCDPSTCVGIGFDEDDQKLTVPPRLRYGTAPSSWATPGAVCDKDAGQSEAGLADLSGDGYPDLFETYFCGEDELGSTKWLVHLGGPDGYVTPAVDWPLPSRVAADPSGFVYRFPFSTPHACGKDYASQTSFADWDADGTMDILETYACGDDPEGLGLGKWRLHRGTATGFSQTPHDYTLPPRTGSGLPHPSFFPDPVGDDGRCDDQVQASRYRLFDMNGDAIPDIVETYACAADGIGSTQWRVFYGTADGFETTPRSWSLPSRTRENVVSDWPALSSAGTCGANNKASRYSLVDLTSDGFADLVETDLCGEGKLGFAHWNVYPGSDEGFDDTPIEWLLPERTRTGKSPSRWPLLVSEAVCGAESLSAYDLYDIEGDGDIDLVETDLCGSTSLGVESWSVYRNGGTQFSPTRVAWRLPTRLGGFPTVGFQSRDCDEIGLSTTFSLVDVNADGIDDYVKTYDCDATVGLSRLFFFVHRGACSP